MIELLIHTEYVIQLSADSSNPVAKIHIYLLLCVYVCVQTAANWKLQENTQCDHHMTSDNLHRMYDVDLDFNVMIAVSLVTEGKSVSSDLVTRSLPNASKMLVGICYFLSE